MDLHANLFRTTFGDPEQAEGLLRAFLPPAFTAAIDWRTLAFCDPGFVDQDVRHSDADLLFSMSIGGRPAFVYLLLEHKSTDEPLTAFQVLRYVVRIHEQWLRDHPGTTRLPPVVPLVVHHGPRGWRSATDVAELLDLDGLDGATKAFLHPLSAAPALPARRLARGDARPTAAAGDGAAGAVGAGLPAVRPRSEG